MRRLVALLVVAVLPLGATEAASGAARSKQKAKPRAGAPCIVKKAGRRVKGRIVVKRVRGKRVRRCVAPKRRRPATPVAPPAMGTGLPVPGAAVLPVLPAPPVAPAPPDGTSVPVAPSVPAPTGCGTSPWLGVTAEDVDGTFRLRFSRTCVPAGRVLVQFRNIDLQPHNLWAEGIAPAAPVKRVIADIDGESSTQGETALARGRWRLFCSIPGHEAMTKVITAE